MTTSSLSLSDLAHAEERLLSAKLDAVRAAIRHSGEKGRALEVLMLEFLRSFLPREYGLTTGFVAYHDGAASKLSKQLDIIIYDAIHGAPLASLGTCDVFPIESVLGYAEIKAALRSSANVATAAGDTIERCISDNHELRKMRQRQYLVDTDLGLMRHVVDALPLRGYVFALEGRGRAGKIRSLAQRIREVSRTPSREAHLHGVFVGGSGFAYTVPSTQYTPPDQTHHVRYTDQDPLMTLKLVMLEQLATFWRPPRDWFVHLGSYSDQLPKWDQTITIPSKGQR